MQTKEIDKLRNEIENILSDNKALEIKELIFQIIIVTLSQ